MQNKSSKDYWNYINSLCDKKKKNVTVDSNIFLNFFKDLNSNIDVDDEPKPEFPNVTVTNDLDNAITEVEIRKAIRKIKTGKSSGLDNITNEYIKSSCELLNFYFVLFMYFLQLFFYK